MRLAVGYPWSSPFTWTGFADHLPNLQRPEGVEVRFFRGAGWCPARRHISICEQALEWGADLILIIGADQIHPEDMLPRLYERWKETGGQVIAALVPSRAYVGWQEMRPFQPMAWRFKRETTTDIRSIRPREYKGMGTTADLMEVIDPSAGDLQEVNFIGSGVLMFHRDHLLALSRPWFKETIERESYQRLANMDCTFVYRLQVEAYARVYVDTTIKVKHLHAFEIDESFQHRFPDWMEPGQGPKDICRYNIPEEIKQYQEQLHTAGV